MSGKQDKTRRWWQFRLWHLFALLSLMAVILWVSQHLSLEIVYSARSGYFQASWNDVELFEFHTVSYRKHGGVI